MLGSICKCNGIFADLLRASFLRTYSTTVHPRVKLSEVPGVCSSEEWNSVIQESQVALQRIVSPVRRQIDRDHILPIQAVIRRLEESSRNSSYLINTFRQLLTNSETNVTELRWPGLISLMLSIGIGNPFEADNFVCKALEDVIWSTQITLAEAMNLLYCNFLFQKEYQRFASSKRTATKRAVTENQIHRLINNYFTSSTLQRISRLENDKVLFLFSKVLRVFCYQEIFKHFRVSLELAGHGEQIQQSGFEFGRCFALAIKANADIRQFWNYQTSLSSIINISSFPVALHLSNNPETLAYLYSCKKMLLNLDYNELNNILMNNAAMEDAKLQLTTYVEKATNLLQELHSVKNYELIELLLKLVKTLENTDH
ncbi:decaprenyl-diphosphate synthase subunit 2 [Trichonephila inaurata madagascariensis]|uniref:Decaprenyl-diphosphate synthase subunit 2 n=1 Tax=Trichonephila inaurata madagascariensis TaxID=2747483 RepID=A0A8X7C3G6_9ARAC|nr:decaprenyl-diphosphate synthase subunit 2 [Trichonephila inaurata madagascariensis]